jgi:hypothetical protein
VVISSSFAREKSSSRPHFHGFRLRCARWRVFSRVKCRFLDGQLFSPACFLLSVSWDASVNSSDPLSLRLSSQLGSAPNSNDAIPTLIPFVPASVATLASGGVPTPSHSRPCRGATLPMRGSCLKASWRSFRKLASANLSSFFS